MPRFGAAAILQTMTFRARFYFYFFFFFRPLAGRS